MRCTLFFLAVLPLALCGRTEAGYLNDFSGNWKGTTTTGGPKITSNFAVLDRLAGASSAGDVFGTGMPSFDNLFVASGGSANFDTTARYLYLWQEVASPTSTGYFDVFGGGSSSIAQFSSVTSYQQWNLLLTDDAGPVSTSNDFGLDGVAFMPTAMANKGVANPNITANSSGISLAAMTAISLTSTGFSGNFNPVLTSSRMTRIFGYTTNLPPGFLTTASGPNSVGAETVVPVLPAPEASSLTLLCIGAGTFFATGGQRGRRS